MAGKNYTQKRIVDGTPEEMYPKTVAAQVVTDSRRQFVSAAEKKSYEGKQDALGFEPENSENKDKPGGYAGLDADGRLDEALLLEAVKDRAKIFVSDTAPEEAQEGDFWFDTSSGAENVPDDTREDVVPSEE